MGDARRGLGGGGAEFLDTNIGSTWWLAHFITS